MPAYNEAHRLPRLLEALRDELDPVLETTSLALEEVIVVDDGSSDGTAEVVEEFAYRELTLIRLPENRGKGAAVRIGMLRAGGDLALMSDADLSTPLQELTALTAALDAGCDMAIASRSLPDSRILRHQPAHREWMGKTFNVVLRLLTGIPFRDTQCGFKLFQLETTRVLFETQRVEGFAFDAELCVNARRLGLSVEEVPVRWIDDPDTRVALLGSSVRMGLDLLRIAWSARRPLRVRS